MVCIAAFIILVILSIFSAKFRKPLKKAWYCISRKVTFRKCDSNFKDEIKNGILRKVVILHPGWIRPMGAIVEVGAVLIVAVSAVSLFVVAKTIVNIIAYGSCADCDWIFW
jgi:hypothetical protein